ncbi:MAG: SPOR domain-containing protein [Hydrotalea sp.]|nr:SPOR domain-containing protein [Hydrotalea sp.]
MSNDILDKGSPGRRIILLLTLLLLLISALIFLFNRASFLGGGGKSTEPVVITPGGAVKTFPDDSQKNGEMPAAKVYDMLQKTPPASSNTATNKKPNSVGDIVDNSAGKPATGQATQSTQATPAPATANQNKKQATNNTAAAKKPNDKPNDKVTAKPTVNNAASNAANKPAAKPTTSVADLVSSNGGNEKPSQATKEAKKPADKTATTKPADKTASTATTKPAAKPTDDSAKKMAKDIATNVANQPGKYVLQLASFTDEATAQKYLNSIKPRLDKIIGGKGISLRVGSAVLSTGQNVYRSQVVGFQTKEQANEACEKIKSQLATSAKPDCLVLKSF